MSTTLFELPSNCFEIATQKYNRSVQSLNEDVATLKEWFKSQPHLPETMPDAAIRNFLVLNKCSIERTKQKIDMYYTIRRLLPEIYDAINPKHPEVCGILKYFNLAPLPKTTTEGYRIFVAKMHRLPKDFKLDLFAGIRVAINVQEVRLFEDCIVGDIAIVDFEHAAMEHILGITPTVAAKMLATYQKVYSTPLKAIYVVNAPAYITALVTVARTIMKPKIFDRIKITSDASILKDVLPMEMLPKDYGGNGQTLQELNDLVEAKLNEYQWRFDKLDQLRTDENLRPEKLENDQFLGFHGNFKKIELD